MDAGDEISGSIGFFIEERDLQHHIQDTSN